MIDLGASVSFGMAAAFEQYISPKFPNDGKCGTSGVLLITNNCKPPI